MLRASSYPSIHVLGQQHTPVSKTDADTVEASLYSLAIPAGMMGPNDSLVLQPLFSASGVAVARTVRVRIGGGIFDQWLASASSSSASVLAFAPHWRCSNRGSLASQVVIPVNSAGIAGAVSAPLNYTTVDFSSAQTLFVTAQWGGAGTGSNSITLESVIVMIIRGA